MAGPYSEPAILSARPDGTQEATISYMKSFFPMARGEKLTLVFLLLYSAVSFLPLWSSFEVAGMVAFGWLMAALMVISPALALVVFLRKKDRG